VRHYLEVAKEAAQTAGLRAGLRAAEAFARIDRL